MQQITPETAIQIAVKHHQAGRLPEAEALYQQILSAQPDHPDALHLLGVVALQTGRTDFAIDLLFRAVEARPASAEYQMNLGIALRQKWRLDDAIAAYRRAIALKPQYPEAHNNLGNALTCQGKLEEAIACYESAIRLRPEYIDALGNLGFALKDMGKLDEALSACEKVIALNPNSAAAHSNLANVLKDQGRVDEALISYDRAIALNPADAGVASSRLYLLHFHPGYDSHAIYCEHRKWNDRYARPLRVTAQPHPNVRDPARRLKIGYVSPDFGLHPVGRFLLPLLKNHDRAAFEIFCYSDVRTPDAMTDRLRGASDHWQSILGLSDEVAAQRVRQDEIDILVDLTMHTANSRLLAFARRPAPVQATWLAYCSTTGMDAIDYRFTDAYLDPPGTGDEHYSEQSIRLRSYWCYDPGVPTPDVEPPPSLASGNVMFGCLNNFAKVSPGALLLWSRILREVPDSRLLLHAREGNHRQRLRDVLEQQGVDPAKVTFEGPIPMDEYFNLYRRIDIALDPIPYAGGTTTCDALWMGVPVVTLAGKTAVSRAGASILGNAGLAELVAHSEEQYIAIAKRLASDLPALERFRAESRGRLRATPLMDAPGFARDMELAYRRIWKDWCGRQNAGVDS